MSKVFLLDRIARRPIILIEPLVKAPVFAATASVNDVVSHLAQGPTHGIWSLLLIGTRGNHGAQVSHTLGGVVRFILLKELH